MASPTRTVGPLHLEDLEPHRFEDMVRQLIYDFRNWRALESTGRSGSDDGFDARGFEIVDDGELGGGGPDADDEVAELAPTAATDRTWLVQCKRERRITPKKLAGYLADIPETERVNLYGIIFVGACDFSKEARDKFRLTIRELGFAEGYLWGRGEVEDMLFQPKNDHLLFAYFGISLQTRRRRLKTDVRARLTTKRKAMRVLTEHQPVLIRDATDDRYPYLDDDKQKERVKRGRWMVLQYAGCFHDGLRFTTRRHFAFIDDDGEHWDYADTMNDARVRTHENPWREDAEEPTGEREAAFNLWNGLPEHSRAWFEIAHVLPFESILDIDEKGDDWSQVPHIYTTEFQVSNGPFREYYVPSLETIERFSKRYARADDEKRVGKFPRNTRASPE
jgi:hypothetical protein